MLGATWPAATAVVSDVREYQPPVGISSWQESKADNAVTVVYVDNGCPRQNVVADVKEDAKAVYVALRADAPPPDQMCTEQAVFVPFEVALQAPLGGREVIDAATGKPLPHS